MSLVIREKSHPVWVRGLKSRHRRNTAPLQASHPVWVRGLKFHHHRDSFGHHHVAPRVGAWIEIVNVGCWEKYIKSHPVWVRGLKYG